MYSVGYASHNNNISAEDISGEPANRHATPSPAPSEGSSSQRSSLIRTPRKNARYYPGLTDDKLLRHEQASVDPEKLVYFGKLPAELLFELWQKKGVSYPLSLTARDFNRFLNQNLMSIHFPGHEHLREKVLESITQIGEQPPPLILESSVHSDDSDNESDVSENSTLSHTDSQHLEIAPPVQQFTQFHSVWDQINSTDSPDLTEELRAYAARFQSTFNDLSALIQSGTARFSPAQRDSLLTYTGFAAAQAHYAFLQAFHAESLENLRGIYPELQYAFMLSQYNKIKDNPEIPDERKERAEAGLLNFFTELLKQNRKLVPEDHYLFSSTLHGFEMGNDRLNEFIQQNNSPWFDDNFPHYRLFEVVKTFDKQYQNWVIQKNSPFFALSNQHKIDTTEAIHIGKPDLSAWITQKDSSWIRMGDNTRMATLKVMEEADDETVRWLTSANSPLSRFNDFTEKEEKNSGHLLQAPNRPIYFTGNALRLSIPFVREFIFEKHSKWPDIAQDLVPNAENYLLGEYTVKALTAIDQHFSDTQTKNHLAQLMLDPESHWFQIPSHKRLPVMRAIEHQNVPLLELYFTYDGLTEEEKNDSYKGSDFVYYTGELANLDDPAINRHLVDPNSAWREGKEPYTRETHHIFRGMFQSKQLAQLSPETRAGIIDFLFDKQGSWVQSIAPAMEKDLFLSRSLPHLRRDSVGEGYDLERSQGRLLAECIRSANQYVLALLLREQKHIPRMSVERLYGLTLAAETDNHAFADFCMYSRAIDEMPTGKIFFCKDIFIHGDPRILHQIEKDPGILSRFSEQDLQLAFKLRSANPNMLAFAKTFSTSLNAMGEEKLKLTTQAFEQSHPQLNQYLLRSDQRWLSMSPEQMRQIIAIFQSKNPYVIQILIDHTEHLHKTGPKQLYGLALAAQENSRAFADFCKNGHVLNALSQEKIFLCKDLFTRGHARLAQQLQASSHAVPNLSIDNLRLGLMLGSLNDNMLAFAHRFPATANSFNPVQIEMTCEAFERNIPELTRYVLRNDELWRTMNSDQMRQTIRVFEIGNGSLIKKIIANRDKKHWHELSADEMCQKNDTMESGSAFSRFRARRGKWEAHRQP